MNRLCCTVLMALAVQSCVVLPRARVAGSVLVQCWFNVPFLITPCSVERSANLAEICFKEKDETSSAQKEARKQSENKCGSKRRDRRRDKRRSVFLHVLRTFFIRASHFPRSSLTCGAFERMTHHFPFHFFMPRILITGGAGFLGSHLCERFLSEGYDVLCMDNFITGTPDNVAHLIANERFHLVKHDVTEYIYVAGTLDYILHFASPACRANQL
jgi:hypothetical protein